MSFQARRFRRPLRAVALTVPALLLLTGCSFDLKNVSGMGFPKGVSSVNDISLSLWQGAWIAGGVVGVFTLILILWPAVFHRAKVGQSEFPKQTQYNVPVEVLYTVILQQDLVLDQPRLELVMLTLQLHLELETQHYLLRLALVRLLVVLHLHLTPLLLVLEVLC